MASVVAHRAAAAFRMGSVPFVQAIRWADVGKGCRGEDSPIVLCQDLVELPVRLVRLLPVRGPLIVLGPLAVASRANWSGSDAERLLTLELLLCLDEKIQFVEEWLARVGARLQVLAAGPCNGQGRFGT